MLTTVSTDDEKLAAVPHSEDERIVQLATAAAHGDDAAFVELYGIFSQRVFNLVLRSVHDRGTAEDLCQEIWLKVHHEIKKLRAPEAIRAWLYRIASHACIDFARSSRAARASDEELVEDFVQAYDPMPEDAAIQGSQVRMVWETLATMAPRQSIALYLKQVDGRSYDEIGSILNCSRETVESLLFRARQSFVRAYDRVQSSPVERCHLFQQVVADVVDNEPTQLQKSAIHAHMQECMSCRQQLPEMAAAAKGYSLLPLLPFTKGLVLQTLASGAAVGTVIGVTTPSATTGLVAALSLKAKLATLFGLLAVGATGAASTNIIEVPIAPDLGAIFRSDPGHAENAQLISGAGSNSAADLQTGNGTADGAPALHGGDPNAARRRDSKAGSTTGEGDVGSGVPDGPAGPQRALPPAAPGSGDTGGSLPGNGEGSIPSIVPGVTDPLDTLIQTPIGVLDAVTGGTLGNTLGTLDGTLEQLDGTLGDVAGLADDTLGGLGETVGDVLAPVDPILDDLTGGVVDDTLDTLLPPPSSETPGPIEDLLDGVDDTLDDVLPGDDEDDGLLGAILNPVLPPPSATQPPADNQAPPPAPPAPPCLLGILC